MTKGFALFLLLVFTACLVGYVRGRFSRPPRAGSRPADDPAGGFATPQQVRQRLSEHAVRAAANQVRPGLVRLQKPKPRRQRRLSRGHR